uniref:Store-operated calcium entry-associated regulatory factor n=1 Tax=Wuchereria bancrofti TaxID=6293 RepID=A0AAF5RWC3_WUCBA
MLWWSRLYVIFLIGIVNLCEGSGKVRLVDVTTLTLYRDKYTTGRRSSPIPQIQCVGGSANGKFEPRVVQCYNRGYDGVDVQWECKAEMGDQYEFGEIRISCEGYDYAGDPYILRGSCGLKYNLEYSHERGNNYGKNNVPNAPPYEKDHEFGSLTLSSVAILLLFLFVVYYSCLQPTTDDDRTRRSVKTVSFEVGDHMNKMVSGVLHTVDIEVIRQDLQQVEQHLVLVVRKEDSAAHTFCIMYFSIAF